MRSSQGGDGDTGTVYRNEMKPVQIFFQSFISNRRNVALLARGIYRAIARCVYRPTYGSTDDTLYYTMYMRPKQASVYTCNMYIDTKSACMLACIVMFCRRFFC